MIDYMEEQKRIRKKGGTMRLGSYPCFLKTGTLAHHAYGKDAVTERHRHRLEVNNDFRDTLSEHGLVMSGIWPEGDLVEIIEYPDHPWFLAVQFHPELKSRFTSPHPLFRRIRGSITEACTYYTDNRKSAAGSIRQRLISGNNCKNH